MKIENIINETPLPDTWDKDVYVSDTPFPKMIKYAVERSKKIGAGSSRVAFEVEYQGRPTILKIAKNEKGVAQNNEEAAMFDDYYVEQLEITIPMIDYDEENKYPLWIHTEKAKKITISEFRNFFKLESWYELPFIVNHFAGIRTDKRFDTDYYNELYENNHYINSLVDLVGSYDLPAFEFAAKGNWGIYKGRPVIIDLGLTYEIYKLHYSQKHR